jgi:hypothetical protein
VNKIRCLTLLALALAACATIQPAHLSDDDRQAVEIFKTAWAASSLPALDGCFVDEARVLHTATARDFERECRYPVDRAASCISQITKQSGLRVYALPLVVLRPGQASIDSFGGGPVVHELIHWASGCVLDQPGSGLNAQDRDHKDTRLWLVASKDPAVRSASVQGRAASILTQLPPAPLLAVGR